MTLLMRLQDVEEQGCLGRYPHRSRAVKSCTWSGRTGQEKVRCWRGWLLRKGLLVAVGPRDEVLTPAYLAEAYGVPCRRLDIEGHRMLLAAR